MFSRLCKKLWSKHEDRPLVHSSSVQGQSFTGLSVGSRDRDPNVNRLRRKCIFQRAAATHQTIDRERCQISEWEAADGVSDAAVLSSANWESKILICEPRKRSSRSDQDLSSSSPPSSEAKVTEEDSVGGTPRRQGYDHSALRWASRPQKRQTIAVRRGQRPLLLDLSSHLPRCTERSKPKEEDLAWSVDDLSHLPETLRHLLVNGYTACEIGKVMETILHGRDGFMGGNITALIDMQASYAEIGRAVIQYWRRRTGDDVLLTLKVKPGNMSMRPTHPSLFPQQSTVRRKPLPKKDANRNPPSANRPFVQLPSYSSHEAANNVHILQHHEKLPAANAVGLKLCHGNLPLRYVHPDYKTPIVCPRPHKPQPTVTYLDDFRRLQMWEQERIYPHPENLGNLETKQNNMTLRITDPDIDTQSRWLNDVQQAEFEGFAEICPAAEEMQETFEYYMYSGHTADKTQGYLGSCNP